VLNWLQRKRTKMEGTKAEGEKCLGGGKGNPRGTGSLLIFGVTKAGKKLSEKRSVIKSLTGGRKRWKKGGRGK